VVPRSWPAASALARAALPAPALVLAALAALAARPAPARAGAELSGVEVAAVREAGHRVSLRIDGIVAAVESRQQIVNPGDRDTQVFYAFELPPDAAVTGVEIRLPDGRRAVSAAIDSRSAFRFIPEEDAPGAPDIGLLRRLDAGAAETGAPARYELRVYPVPAGKSVTATVRWVAPLRYQDGRLSLRVPGRGDAANLVRERIELSWRAPAGARELRELRAGDRTVARAAAARPVELELDAPVGTDLVVEARPGFAASSALVAEIAAAPTGRQSGAAALPLLAPRSPAKASPDYERVVLVMDVSRSMGASGLAAARAIADALLAAATPSAAAEVVLFDRRSRAVTGALTARRADLRAQSAAALAPADPSNGSDLGAALDTVADLLRRAGSTDATPVGAVARGASSSTLIVIVTDGMLPLDLDGAQAASRIGSLALHEARVASVVLVPDGAPLPHLGGGPLGELARRTGGRVVAVRHGEAASRAASLWAELGQPAPLRGIQVDWPGATFTASGAVPDQLEPGEGALVVGWYHGRRPGAVRIRGEVRGRSLAVTARPGGAALRGAAVPLALISRPAEELLAPDELEPEHRAGRDLAALARARAIAAAHRAGVLAEHTSLVVLDQKDPFARDRLALARKWGTAQFRRHPSPSERAVGEKPPRTGRLRRAASTPAPRKTGELDRAVVERLMKHHVVPRARACYDRALRRAPKLAGTVVIELEMARGEVQDARLAKNGLASGELASCLIDAAYATPVPKVALGDTREAVVVARYPLRFRTIDRRIEVGPPPDSGTAVDPNDPLGGIDP